MTNLHKLDLSDSSVSSLPNSIGNLEYLKEFDLSRTEQSLDTLIVLVGGAEIVAFCKESQMLFFVFLLVVELLVGKIFLLTIRRPPAIYRVELVHGFDY